MERVDTVRGVLVAIALLGLTACGNADKQTTTTTTTETAQPPVSAPADAATAPAEKAAQAEAAAETAETAQGVAEKGCLDLVAAEKYAEAVTACTAALEAQPESAELKQALETATAKAAGIPAVPKTY